MSNSAPFVHEVCIRVTNIITVDHFYAQIGTSKLLKEFDEFSSKLNTWGKGRSDRSSRFPELRSYVLVRDGTSWLRAFVTDIMDKGVKVFLIDVGRSRDVTSTDDVCGKAPPQMLSLAQQALHCVLVDIQQKFEWSFDDIQAFRGLITRADELQCSVYPERDGKCPIVMYHREVGGIWKSIGASLEQLGVSKCIPIPEVKARIDQMNISYAPSLPKHPVMLSQKDSGISAMADYPSSNTITAETAMAKDNAPSVRAMSICTQLSLSENSDSESDSMLQQRYSNITADNNNNRDEHGTQDIAEENEVNAYSDTEESTLASQDTPNIESSQTPIKQGSASPPGSSPPPLTPDNDSRPLDSRPLSPNSEPLPPDNEPLPNSVQVVPNIQESSSDSSIDGDWDDTLLTPSIPHKHSSDDANSYKQEKESKITTNTSSRGKSNERTRKVKSPLLKTPSTGGSGYSMYNRTPRPKSNRPFTPYGSKYGHKKGPANQHTPSFNKKETERTFTGQGRGRGYAKTRQPSTVPSESVRRSFNASTSPFVSTPTASLTKANDGIFSNDNTTHSYNNQPGVDREDITSRDQPVPIVRSQVLSSTSVTAGLTSSEAVKNETDWLTYKIETDTKKIQSSLPDTAVFIEKVSLILNGSSSRKLCEVSPSIRPLSIIMAVLVKWIIANNAVDDDSVMKTIHELYTSHSENISAAFPEACIRVFQDYCENSVGSSDSTAKRERFCCFLEKLYLHCQKMDLQRLLSVVIDCLHSLVFNWIMKLSKKGNSVDCSIGYVKGACVLCNSLGLCMDQHNRKRLDELFECTVPNIITGDVLDQSLKLDLLELLRNRDKWLLQLFPIPEQPTYDGHNASVSTPKVTKPLQPNDITTSIANPTANEPRLPSSDNRIPSNRPVKVVTNSPITRGYGEISSNDSISTAGSTHSFTGMRQRRVTPSSPSPHPQGPIGSRNFTLTPDPSSIGLFKGSQPMRSHSYDGTACIPGGSALSPAVIGYNPAPSPIISCSSPDDSYNLVSTMLYNLKLTEFLPVFKSAMIQDSLLTIDKQELKDVLKEVAIPPGAIVSILQYVTKSLVSSPTEPERNQFFPQQSSTYISDDAASIVHTASPSEQHQSQQDTTYAVHKGSHGIPPPLVPQQIKPIREPQNDSPTTKLNNDQSDKGGRDACRSVKPAGTRGFGMTPMCVMCGSREHRGYACPKRAELLFADQPKLN